jgi:carbonic anhydrase/acetyltransferase-like protein (isoleucine patch superfamily)
LEILGDQNSVKIGVGCSIGDRVTIQASSLDTWDGDKPVVIGDLTIVGNFVYPSFVFFFIRFFFDLIEAGAILYACTIAESVVIGMGAIVHAGAVIGKGAIIEAGSVILKGTVVGEGEVWNGNPAKFVRKATQEDFREHGRLIQQNKLNQVRHSFEFNKTPQELYDAWRLKQIGGPIAKTSEPTEVII